MFILDHDGAAVAYECSHGYDSQCCGVERDCPAVGVTIIEMFNQVFGKK